MTNINSQIIGNLGESTTSVRVRGVHADPTGAGSAVYYTGSYSGLGVEVNNNLDNSTNLSFKNLVGTSSSQKIFISKTNMETTGNNSILNYDMIQLVSEGQPNGYDPNMGGYAITSAPNGIYATGQWSGTVLMLGFDGIFDNQATDPGGTNNNSAFYNPDGTGESSNIFLTFAPKTSFGNNNTGGATGSGKKIGTTFGCATAPFTVRAYGIDTDNTFVYICGSYSGSDLKLGNSSLEYQGTSTNGFLACFSQTGLALLNRGDVAYTPQWAISFSGSGDVEILDVFATPSATVQITGYSRGSNLNVLDTYGTNIGTYTGNSSDNNILAFDIIWSNPQILSSMFISSDNQDATLTNFDGDCGRGINNGMVVGNIVGSGSINYRSEFEGKTANGTTNITQGGVEGGNIIVFQAFSSLYLNRPPTTLTRATSLIGIFSHSSPFGVGDRALAITSDSNYFYMTGQINSTGVSFLSDPGNITSSNSAINDSLNPSRGFLYVMPNNNAGAGDLLGYGSGFSLFQLGCSQTAGCSASIEAVSTANNDLFLGGQFNDNRAFFYNTDLTLRYPIIQDSVAANPAPFAESTQGLVIDITGSTLFTG